MPAVRGLSRGGASNRGRLRRDGKDADGRRKLGREGSEIVLVGAEHRCPRCARDQDSVGVNDICRSGGPEQGTDRVSVGGGEGDDFAAAQESAELGLPTGATDLGDDGGCGHRGHPELEPRPVVGPHGSVVAVGGDQHAGVVDEAHAGVDRAEPLSAAATRRRAAASSASVKVPCSASHSATARRPSRTSSARLAALVIQAETLMPSS